MTIDARSITDGVGRGQVLCSPDPISFYGAVDPETGEFNEPGHPLDGTSVAGSVLVFPKGKGSTVGSYVLYGLAQNDRAPAAIINAETEPIVATGAILGEIPCVDRPGVDLDAFETGMEIVVDATSGQIERIEETT